MLSNVLAEISSPLQDFITPDSIERRDAGKQNEICIPGIGLEPAKSIHLETPIETFKNISESCDTFLPIAEEDNTNLFNTRLHTEDHPSDPGTSILLAIQNFVKSSVRTIRFHRVLELINLHSRILIYRMLNPPIFPVSALISLTSQITRFPSAPEVLTRVTSPPPTDSYGLTLVIVF